MRSTAATARMPSIVVRPETGRNVPTLWAEPARLLITGAASGGAYTATELSARPGWARPAYVHHEVDECFYVADGEFEVELDDQPQPVRLRRGSLLYVPRGVARSLCNPGTATGRLLLLQTPGRSPDESPQSGVEVVGASPVPDTQPRERGQP